MNDHLVSVNEGGRLLADVDTSPSVVGTEGVSDLTFEARLSPKE